MKLCIKLTYIACLRVKTMAKETKVLSHFRYRLPNHYLIEYNVYI